MMKHKPHSEKYMGNRKHSGLYKEMMMHKKHPHANVPSSEENAELVEPFGDGYGKKCPNCHPNEQPFLEVEDMQGNDLLSFYPVRNWPTNDTPCASCPCNKNL